MKPKKLKEIEENIVWVLPDSIALHLMDDDGYSYDLDLGKYLNSIISRPGVYKWKLVECGLHPTQYSPKYEKEWYDTWGGNWVLDNGKEYFLTTLHVESDEKMESIVKYYEKYFPQYIADFTKYWIYCQGTDDGIMEKRNIKTLEEAEETYALIMDGCFHKDLEDLGFTC